MPIVTISFAGDHKLTGPCFIAVSVFRDFVVFAFLQSCFSFQNSYGFLHLIDVYSICVVHCLRCDFEFCDRDEFFAALRNIYSDFLFTLRKVSHSSENDDVFADRHLIPSVIVNRIILLCFQHHAIPCDFRLNRQFLWLGCLYQRNCFCICFTDIRRGNLECHILSGVIHAFSGDRNSCCTDLYVVFVRHRIVCLLCQNSSSIRYLNHWFDCRTGVFVVRIDVLHMDPIRNNIHIADSLEATIFCSCCDDCCSRFICCNLSCFVYFCNIDIVTGPYNFLIICI